MKLKDLDYFKKQIEKVTKEEAANAIQEMEGYLAGIEKGLAVLKKMGKYPDQIVLQNKKGFSELITRYRQKFNLK